MGRTKLQANIADGPVLQIAGMEKPIRINGGDIAGIKRKIEKAAKNGGGWVDLNELPGSNTDFSLYVSPYLVACIESQSIPKSKNLATVGLDEVPKINASGLNTFD